MQNNSKAHPYMPSSAGAAQQEMLSAIGLKNTQQLFDQIPEHHRISVPLDLPGQLKSEVELKRHLLSVLKKNVLILKYGSTRTNPMRKLYH